MEYRKQIDNTPELAEWYSQKYLEMGDGWNTPAEECHRHLDDLGVPFDLTRTLLDVGCGAGHFLAEAEKRVQSTGIEISAIGVELCRRRCKKASIMLGSMEGILPLGGGGYDYIVSIGSLEHIVDLDKALDRIRALLKPSGKFYFYCPNERWSYQDQPNERTMLDEEWRALFTSHGLQVAWSKRWGDNQDNTAFCGVQAGAPARESFIVPANPKINAGSGQRPFNRELGWVNLDCQDKYGPDLVANWNDLYMFENRSVETVVAHHTIEHVGCGEAQPFIREAHRVLKPGGSLLVFVPNMRALAQRWLSHQIDDFTFFVNAYGAYMGDDADRHRWGYTWESLHAELLASAEWDQIRAFDWRAIPGADIARDWWILGVEAIK